MAEEACMHTEALKEVENKIRDVLNWVAVWKTEEKIKDEEAAKLEAELRAIAEKLGIETI